jgi:TrbL/VirB6 plasmid conjugal transfer protein
MDRRRLLRGTLATVLLGILVGLGWSGPAGAGQPDPDRDPTLTFQWEDTAKRDAFKACVDIVHWVARGRPGDEPEHFRAWPWQDPPPGIEDDLWEQAMNSGWFRRPQFQEFTYRPHCEVLLPADYVTRISVRYYSEVFAQCLAVVGGDTAHERPKVVPAWYWEVSLRTGHCYLLLPMGAFGLGDDENDWSRWSSEGEGDDPTSHPDPAVMEAYRVCQDEYIDWRMDHGRAGAGGPGSVFDDAPGRAVPDRVWNEAIDFYADPNGRGRDTVPDEWRPDCSLLLLVNSECHRSGGDNRALLPEQCLGPHPISHYDIGYSAYDDVDEEGDQSIPRHLWGGTTNMVFGLGTWGIRIANWAVDWAYGFDIQQYDQVATRIGDAYQTSLLSDPRLRLDHLFWVLLVGWCGFMALRGKAAVAGGEILVTIVLLMISGTLLEKREMYMDATWRLIDKTSTALLVAGMGRDAGDDSLPNRDRLVDDLQRQIQFTFVEEPYDYLNWGESLGDPNAEPCTSTGPPALPEGCNPVRACAAARYEILSRGPHGGDPWPRRHMAAAGQECQEMADFNRDPNGTRMLGALLVMVSAFIVAGLLIVVGLTIVVAKLIGLLLFAVLPFVVIFVTLPSQGRRFVWSWATTVMQVVLAAIGMSFLMSLLLLSLNQLTKMTTEVDLIERFALMDILVLIVWSARRSLLHSGQMFAARLSEYLSATRGTGVTWREAAAGSIGRGTDLLNVDRTVGIAVGRPLTAATSSVLLRMHERRAQRRGYRNLTRVAKWKRNVNYRKSVRDTHRRQTAPHRTPRPWNFPLP